MRSLRPVFVIGIVPVVVGLAAEQREARTHAQGTAAPQRPEAPIKIDAETLHKHGGVPAGWRFAFPSENPKAGREVFIKLEYYKCHEITGEQFPHAPKGPDTAGPELTGMGERHPVEYLAESILNPNAVILTGPGHTGPDGLSIMPDYRESLSVGELIDLVAYLKSLRGGHDPAPAGAPGTGGHTQERH